MDDYPVNRASGHEETPRKYFTSAKTASAVTISHHLEPITAAMLGNRTAASNTLNHTYKPYGRNNVSTRSGASKASQNNPIHRIPSVPKVLLYRFLALMSMSGDVYRVGRRQQILASASCCCNDGHLSA